MQDAQMDATAVDPTTQRELQNGAEQKDTIDAGQQPASQQIDENMLGDFEEDSDSDIRDEKEIIREKESRVAAFIAGVDNINTGS